jgi:hypothetical protein
MTKPVACILNVGELRDRQRAWRTLLHRSLIWRERIPGGLRFFLHPGSSETLNRLVELERACCPWITFAVDGGTLEMTAEGDGEAALLALFGGPPEIAARPRRRD